VNEVHWSVQHIVNDFLLTYVGAFMVIWRFVSGHH